MGCMDHGATESRTRLNNSLSDACRDTHWSWWDHPPLPSFFPKNPSLAPSLSRLMSPSAELQQAVFSWNSRSLFMPPLTSGIRHICSLFLCSSRVQRPPQELGRGATFHAHL